MAQVPEPPKRLRIEQDMDEGLHWLSRQHGMFDKALQETGGVQLRLRPGGFSALISMIVHQQVSLAAAASILKRVKAGVRPMTPERVLELSVDELRACGLSRPKIKSLHDMSDMLATGQVKLNGLHHKDDDTVRAALVSLPGIGPWTAEVYLLSCLGRPDAFPDNDVGLQESVRLLTGDRPSTKELAAMAEDWRPWRGVAARVLWTYINHVRSKDYQS
ncbi:MAG: DNA-3-methyladenine glycosylase 2 family protein [Alphaproteobacteria bacterium]